MLCTASGVVFLQQMDGFMRTCRDWAEVWIGLDGSAMGGRTMGSSWTDHWPSRVITLRSSAHKSLTGEFWQPESWSDWRVLAEFWSDWRVLAEFWQGPALEAAR